MPLSTRARCAVIAALWVIFGVPPVSLRAEPPAERAGTIMRWSKAPAATQKPGRPAFDEAALRRALEKKITVEFIETPLDNALGEIGRKMGLAIDLDTKSLAREGLDPKLPVSRYLKDKPARAVLNMVLREHDLKWIPHARGLTVTTWRQFDPAESQKHLYTKTYDLSRLAVEGWEPREVAAEFTEILEYTNRTDRRTFSAAFEKAVDGRATYLLGTTLSVHNTWAHHQRVSNLFAAMKKARKAYATGRLPESGYFSVPKPDLALVDDASNRAIVAALEQPSELNVTEMPLSKVAEKLSKRHGIQIVVDRPALAVAGLDSDLPFTFKLKGVRLKSLLKALLRPHDLRYFVRDGQLLISTPEVAEAPENVITRIYPIGDLVAPHPLASVDFGQTYDVFAELELILQDIVRPVSWDKAGGPGALLSYEPVQALVVVNRPQVQNEVQSLITALRSSLSQRRAARVSLPTEPIWVIESNSRTAANDATLRRPVEIEVADISIRDLAAKVAESLDLPLLVDVKALALAGVAANTKASLSTHGRSLEDSLAGALKPHDLRIVLDGDIVWLTTPEIAEMQMLTRIYPVGDLTNALWALNEYPLKGAFEVGIYELGNIQDYLKKYADEASWDQYGGPGQMVGWSEGDALVVRNRREVHQQIEAALQLLRETVPSGIAAGRRRARQTLTVAYRLYPAASTKKGQSKARDHEDGRWHAFGGNQYRPDVSLQDLAAAIKDLCEPESWRSSKHWIVARQDADFLIVRNTRKVHRQISDVLSKTLTLEGAEVLQGEHLPERSVSGVDGNKHETCHWFSQESIRDGWVLQAYDLPPGVAQLLVDAAKKRQALPGWMPGDAEDPRRAIVAIGKRLVVRQRAEVHRRLARIVKRIYRTRYTPAMPGFNGLGISPGQAPF